MRTKKNKTSEQKTPLQSYSFWPKKNRDDTFYLCDLTFEFYTDKKGIVLYITFGESEMSMYVSQGLKDEISQCDSRSYFRKQILPILDDHIAEHIKCYLKSKEDSGWLCGVRTLGGQ